MAVQSFSKYKSQVISHDDAIKAELDSRKIY